MAAEVTERLELEIEQLQKDIRRLGSETEDGFAVPFGTLFDDEEVQQYYEALVGTLKSAKKRKIIDFQGQMLLKGAHDSVLIKLLVAESAPAGGAEVRIVGWPREAPSRERRSWKLPLQAYLLRYK